jgi:acyl-[acyl-carrier-protein]-phospholipid O-acyltransferase/long-chain-fatty-acid--[acyl-carrier-protein] ligase
MKTILHFLARLFFRFRAFNTEVLDTPGPVLLIPNHVSWFDWLFLGVVLDKDWKFVTSATTAQTSWFHRKAMINSRTFPIDTLSPYSLRDMAAHLKKGGRLVLFAEGRISRTGELMKLFDGTGFLLHKTGAKVICAHLRNAHRMPFSPNVSLKKWFPTVTAHFSEAFTPPVYEDLRAAKARGVYTRWLRDQIVGLRFDTEMNFGAANLPTAIVETAQMYPQKKILEDINLKALTYERFLAGAGALANGLAERLAQGGGRIGVMLPNTNALPVSLMALWRLDKVPAILNYSVGMATLHACCQVAGLKQVVTSRVFLEKIKLDPAKIAKGGPELIFLEDIKEQIGTMDRLIALASAKFNPSAQYRGIPADETAVVLFTSGSEGVPKGVELTHHNLLANIRQILSVLDLQDDDRFFNSLPMFHSFGLTGATLLPLVRGLYSFVYPSPLHYRVVPTAFYNTNCTVMFGTNTFINGYARKAHPYDFRNLRYLMAGAEKIQSKTAEIWAQRFGVRVLEGYGATECAPALCTNTPMDPKHGSTGRLLPRIEYRLEKVPGVDRGGRLFVKGPNIMKGYLNRDANSQFQKLDGWYDTGDIVDVDEEGFVHILGRLKRFAKVSGEMIGLTAVEDALAGGFPQYGIRCQIAIIARPDPDKGERLIAVSNEKRLSVKEMREVLKAQGHSNLWVPREVIFVKEIPKLGTGKVNHRELETKLKA